jgi:RNA polymerase sigma-70 factor (ECF subfamily)
VSSCADRRRFEQLVRDTRGELLKFVLRRAGNAEDAADVVAETYLIAWRKLDAVPWGTGARLWLFGVARNVLLRGAEQQRSSAVLIERLKEQYEQYAERTRVELAEPDDPLVRALRAGLASLSSEELELITLSAWEGLKPREIARVTGLSANVVRVRLHRARRRLLQRLERARSGPPERMAAANTSKHAAGNPGGPRSATRPRWGTPRVGGRDVRPSGPGS